MCGIAGFISAVDGYRVPSIVWKCVLDAMANRGPDGSGMWEQPNFRVLLLHRRLAIQDLTESGNQPMHSHDRNLTIVFNGEIYNKEELRRHVRDYCWQGTSDTEVILALYEKFGCETPRLLRGMFTFAIWDERQQGLFLARDPYGIKPLYLAGTAEGVWFASQVKTLLRLPGIDGAPEAAGHAGYFLWGSIPEPYTLYRGIRSLRSGHSLWLEHGKAARETEFASIARAICGCAKSSSPASLGEALLSSVSSHFLSDVPISIFLSAGLDSSTILANAASAFPGAALTCLTLGFDCSAGKICDETSQAAQTAAYYGIKVRVRTIGRKDFENEARQFLDAMDQPSVDGVNTYFIARMAHEAGYKVALSGIGGDELFGGYPSFRDIPALVRTIRNIPMAKKMGSAFREWSRPWLKRFTSPKYAGTIEYGGCIEDAYLLRRALFMPWEIYEIIGPELAREGLETLTSSSNEEKELDHIRKFPLYTQVSFLESTRYMRNQLLRDADWAGMAHSLEIRTPLVDFVLLSQIAPLLRSTHPPGKLAMAQTLAKPLPESVLRRKKTGFYVPVREWMMDSLDPHPERGLRSWAKYVYRYQWKAHTS